MILRDHKTNEEIETFPTTAEAFHQLSGKWHSQTTIQMDASGTNERKMPSAIVSALRWDEISLSRLSGANKTSFSR
jgi:hypothetical protein